MSGRITFIGMVQPAVFLDYQSIVYPGAHSKADHKVSYTVQNESLHQFSLVAATPDPFVLHREAKKGARLYSDELNTFTISPIGSAALNAIFDAHDAGKLKLF